MPPGPNLKVPAPSILSLPSPRSGTGPPWGSKTPVTLGSDPSPPPPSRLPLYIQFSPTHPHPLPEDIFWVKL